MHKNMQEIISAFSSDGLRTLCIARRDLPSGIDMEDINVIECDLTCVALVGIEDPLREEVRALTPSTLRSWVYFTSKDAEPSSLTFRSCVCVKSFLCMRHIAFVRVCATCCPASVLASTGALLSLLSFAFQVLFGRHYDLDFLFWFQLSIESFLVSFLTVCVFLVSG